MAKTEILSPAVRVKINNEWVELPALKGEKGDAASTIRVGEVRSGSTASVVNSGTVNDVVLDFVLPKGDRGLQGIQGERGLQGEPGPRGEKGEKGDKGDRGLQGLQGKHGIQGIQGEKGEKGDKGDKGDRGLQGIQGDPLTWDDLTDEQKASLKGEQGLQGEPGPKGDKGDKGQNADSYTFAVGKLYWDEATKNTFLIGNLFVNGNRGSNYDVNAYCKRVNQGQDKWERAQQCNWEGLDNKLVVTFSGSQEDNIKEIRLDFLKNGSVEYSHYIQIPEDGKDGQNGKDGADGQNGNNGQDAPVYTFEVEELRYDEAVNYTTLKGYLVVNGERKSDYNVEGYCRRVNQSQSSWEREASQSWDASNNELTVMFSSNNDLKEIRLDFLKNGSVEYSHYIQIPKDGEKGGNAKNIFFDVDSLSNNGRAVLDGWLIVDGKTTNEYTPSAYYRDLNGVGWLEADEVKYSGKMLIVKVNTQVSAIKIEFRKDGTFVYACSVQFPKQGERGEQGPKGDKGDAGEPAGIGNVTASITAGTTPTVTVTTDGPNTAKNMHFTFDGIPTVNGMTTNSYNLFDLTTKSSIDANGDRIYTFQLPQQGLYTVQCIYLYASKSTSPGVYRWSLHAPKGGNYILKDLYHDGLIVPSGEYLSGQTIHSENSSSIIGKAWFFLIRIA